MTSFLRDDLAFDGMLVPVLGIGICNVLGPVHKLRIGILDAGGLCRPFPLFRDDDGPLMDLSWASLCESYPQGHEFAMIIMFFRI